MRKIGIMGGTFNPIHLGHIELGKCAYEQYKLDKVIYMPAFSPGHRIGEDILPYQYREDMVKLAISDFPYFECSDLEFQRGGYTYTVDTLTTLKELYKDDEFYFIIGADSLYSFHTWRNPDKIMELATLLVATRDDVDMDELNVKIDELSHKYNGQIYPIITDSVPISSTKIRNALKFCEEPKFLDERVHLYICENGLYTVDVDMIKATLKADLTPHRYLHSLSVAQVARELALKYQENDFKAYLAGLLHDCAKSLSDNKKLEICQNNCIIPSQAELSFKDLLHSKVGVIVCREKYNISDADFLNAIYYHTTGHKEMSFLEKAIYVSDYIEPLRRELPNIEYIRKVAFENIDLAVYLITKNILTYLEESNAVIDELGYETLKYYEKLCKDGGLI